MLTGAERYSPRTDYTIDGLDEDGWLAHFHFFGGLRLMQDDDWGVVDRQGVFGFRYDLRALGGSWGQPWHIAPEVSFLYGFGDGEDANGNDWSLNSQTLAVGIGTPFRLAPGLEWTLAGGAEVIRVDLDNDRRGYNDDDLAFGIYGRTGWRWMVDPALSLHGDLRLDFTNDVSFSESEEAPASSVDLTIGLAVRF